MAIPLNSITQAMEFWSHSWMDAKLVTNSTDQNEADEDIHVEQ